MRRIIMILVLAVCFIPFSRAFAEEKKFEGEISVVGKYIGVDANGGGEAKFTEYRDWRESGGLYGRARLNYDTEKYFMNFNARDFGYDTQKYELEGGLWGKFKYDLSYEEIPHNMTFDAKTFFVGAGDYTLIGAPNTNVATWNTFDYSVERRQFGAGFKAGMFKPFFLDASFQREERKGIKPNGIAGTSPSGIGVELPEPVDYLTNNLRIETGYAKNPLFLSVSYLYSDFNNDQSLLNFVNPATAAPDALSLPPDNTFQKGAFKGSLKLPLNSRFSTNLGFGKGKSETSAFRLISPTGSEFDGKADTRNYDFVLTSNPISFLDTKVFYKYYKRDNKSDVVPGVVENFLDYKVSHYGGEIGVRLPARFYLSGGYQYVKTDRSFSANVDLPTNRDNIYSGELRWGGLDFMEVRVGYEKLDRAAALDPDLERPDKMYLYAAQNRDTVKASIDLFPLENLNLGFEYRHKKSDYTFTTYGLKSDERDEFGSSAAYTLGKVARLYGNVDFGLIKFQPDQVRLGRNWEDKEKDRTFGYGFGAEIFAIPNKLTFIFQHDYLKSNGNVDFTIDPALWTAANGLNGANNENVDITRADDYTLYSFKIKALYQFTKSIAAQLGYAYEKFSYRDAQLDGYNYVPAGGAGSNGSYLTGAYKDQSYKANVVFGGLTYKF